MIPPLLITTSAPDLEKSIEKGGALSGRLNTSDGVNHLVDSLTKGLPFEDAHLQKSSGEGSKGGKIVGHTKSGKAIYQTKDWKTHSSLHASFTPGEHQEAGELHHKNLSNKAGISDQDASRHLDNAKMHYESRDNKKANAEGKDSVHQERTKNLLSKGCGDLIPAATDTDVKKKKKTKKSVSDALDDIQKSFKREVPPKPGAKVHKPIKDAEQKREEAAERNSVSKALAFIIDPSRDVKDPLLANTHGEDWHSDADKETVDFLTRTGSVNPDDPVHNPPVTPELNGFPLAIPMFYCSLPASDLLKSDDDTLMQKAFNW